MTPSYDQWCQNVEKALSSIQQKSFRKVVLARKTVLHCASPVDPFALAAWLQGERSQGAHLFALQEGSFGFVGATPELLFRREKNVLESMALAGTKKKNETRPFSEKEKEEWEWVKDHIEKTLSPFCQIPFLFSSPFVHTTFSVKHLCATGKATLSEKFSDRALLKALHPTPALLGAPKEEALSFLQKEEPFSRGLYGGVIGWEGEESSEWFVAIRCCSIRGSHVALYAGAGIVAGSDPKAEWEELNAKEGLFFEAPTQRHS